jgi:Zn-dependent peptidase ImmA (M78 family)
VAQKSVKALVKPEILVWARESAGFQLDDVAAASGLSKVVEWESGKSKPTVNQLRTLAQKYKRPLSVFYLQELPDGFQVIRDFRRHAGAEPPQRSPNLTLAIRAAQERRELALELLGSVGDSPSELPLVASLKDDPESVGAKARALLRVKETTQLSWRTTREAFNGWRSAIEATGVLVFQFDKIEPDEVSGFAINGGALPVIAINRADVPARRIFTSLHEFAHLLLRASGISEYYVDVPRPPEEQRIEIWCNAVAAATVLPREMFLSQSTVRNHDQGTRTWTNSEIEEIAQAFCTSRIVIVRRLLTLKLTDEAFYKSKETQYASEYRAERAKQKAQNKEKDFKGRNMPNEAFSLLGRSYVKMVLAPYHSDRITLRDVSAYLGLKTKHIPNVEYALRSLPST